ncbi:uncharacterized protein N7511_009005 [Penicillium nucicola]|uniref:uncharacterized protein n=1 Tax=Penicillium nucicola TaxID=1850975 RepID=UPI002545378A|nr:uncharacterized protein N7511_009005 [Penicillium nucicola]KAJ5747309.1 hypothetical protein N7511_009005 [Penicillium nucicola]
MTTSIPSRPIGSIPPQGYQDFQDSREPHNMNLPNFFQLESFDWAEDVEEEIALRDLISCSPKSLSVNVHTQVDDFKHPQLPNSSESAGNIDNHFAFHSQKATLLEAYTRALFRLTPRQMPTRGTPLAPIPEASNSVESEFALSPHIASDSSLTRQSIKLSSTLSTDSRTCDVKESCVPASSTRTFLEASNGITIPQWGLVGMDESAEAIFMSRWRATGYDDSIHHYNWLCNPVYERSATPPAVSFACIQAGPKILPVRDRYRVQSIMNRTATFLDPVGLLLESGDDPILKMRGSQLEQACHGRAFKMYSVHGSWMRDNKEDTGSIIEDTGTTQLYRSSTLAVANGFLATDALQSCLSWNRVIEEAAASQSIFEIPRRKTWAPKLSNLRTIDTVSRDDSSLADPVSPQPALGSNASGVSGTTPSHIPQTQPKANRKHRRRTTAPLFGTCGEYFSFPDPVFSELSADKRLKGMIKRRWKAWSHVARWPWK